MSRGYADVFYSVMVEVGVEDGVVDGDVTDVIAHTQGPPVNIVEKGIRDFGVVARDVEAVGFSVSIY